MDRQMLSFQSIIQIAPEYYLTIFMENTFDVLLYSMEL